MFISLMTAPLDKNDNTTVLQLCISIHTLLSVSSSIALSSTALGVKQESPASTLWERFRSVVACCFHPELSFSQVLFQLCVLCISVWSMGASGECLGTLLIVWTISYYFIVFCFTITMSILFFIKFKLIVPKNISCWTKNYRKRLSEITSLLMLERFWKWRVQVKRTVSYLTSSVYDAEL